MAQSKKAASGVPDDAWIERLTVLFAGHPAWIEAARRLSPAATSTVHFTHRPGEPWHLEMREGVARLLPGAAADADLVFRFSPAAIARLESVQGGVGDFALALFEAIVDGDVDLRIRADFARLAARGYVKLLLMTGAPVLAFGAARGVRTPGALRRLVAQVRKRPPADWE